jgi:hypothetical protein
MVSFEDIRNTLCSDVKLAPLDTPRGCFHILKNVLRLKPSKYASWTKIIVQNKDWRNNCWKKSKKV